MWKKAFFQGNCLFRTKKLIMDTRFKMCAQIKSMIIIVKSRGVGDGGILQGKSYLLKINMHSHADCVNKVCIVHPETIIEASIIVIPRRY